MTNARRSEWRHVDSAPEPTAFTRSIDARNRLADTRTYKALILRALDLQSAPCAHVLEVGCAMGADAAELLEQLGPDGRVTAVDVSEVMIEEARRRFAENEPRLTFLTNDAEQLSFPDQSFDRVRADRVVRHLDAPRALRELYRVTASEGLVVVNEPDWQSVMLETENPDLDRDLEVTMAAEDDDPRCGRRLVSMLEAAGFVDVEAAAYVLVSRDIAEVDDVYGLRAGVMRSKPGELFSAEDQHRWVHGADRSSAAGRFLFGLPGFVVRGRRAS